MGKTVNVTIDKIPVSVEELKSMQKSDFRDEFETAALSVAVMCNYENDAQTTIDMIDYLKGPSPLSVYDKQFIRDRLMEKGYVPRSYLSGTSPENDYKPAFPCEVEVSDNPYSYQNDGYATLYLKSSGADSLRQVVLRRKGEQWYLWEIMFLSDIRKPNSLDPWA